MTTYNSFFKKLKTASIFAAVGAVIIGGPMALFTPVAAVGAIVFGAATGGIAFSVGSVGLMFLDHLFSTNGRAGSGEALLGTGLIAAASIGAMYTNGLPMSAPNGPALDQNVSAPVGEVFNCQAGTNRVERVTIDAQGRPSGMSITCEQPRR